MNLEILTQKNPFLMVINGGFHAKPKNWGKQDSNNFAHSTIENVTFQFGLSQIINKLTNMIDRVLFFMN